MDDMKSIVGLLVVMLAFIGSVVLSNTLDKANTDTEIEQLKYTVTEKANDVVTKSCYNGMYVEHYKDTVNYIRAATSNGAEVTMIVPAELYFKYQKGDDITVECQADTLYKGASYERTYVSYSIDGIDITFAE